MNVDSLVTSSSSEELSDNNGSEKCDANSSSDEDQTRGNGENSDIESDDQAEEEKSRTDIRKELSNMSFEELEALKQKLGTKVYDEAMFGKSSSSKSKVSKKKQMEIFKRTNKNRPREMSSKVHVPKIREVVKVKKPVKRDPRFEESSGELKKEIWEKNYDFLREIQDKEIKELQDSLKKEQDPEKRQQIKRYIQSYKGKQKAKEIKSKELEKKKMEKLENKRRVQEGKKPFYMKKSTQKILSLAEKYDELKESGRLEKYLKKKRKKNSTRDRKLIKTQRYFN